MLLIKIGISMIALGGVIVLGSFVFVAVTRADLGPDQTPAIVGLPIAFVGLLVLLCGAIPTLWRGL